jgi:transcription antitermination factor NusG
MRESLRGKSNASPSTSGHLVENIQDRWFIILTEPQRESSAVAGLVARKFSAFSPSVYRAVAVKDRAGRHLKDENGRKRWKKIEEPMFRGYALIRFPIGQERFYDAMKVPGVTKFLRATGGDYNAILPTVLVDAIRAEEDRQLSAYEAAQKTGSDKLGIPFVVGGPARIDGGPYDDWVGKMSKLSKAGRVTLLLSMLGGEVPVEVDGSQVRAA